MPSLDDARETARRELLVKALREEGLDPGLADSVKNFSVRTWEGFIKDPDGDVQKVPQRGYNIQLSVNLEGPQWPVVQPAKPTRITPNKPRPTRTSGWKTAVILPDPQIGYRWVTDPDGSQRLDPFHDERAIEVALDILAAARKAHPIDRVVNLGDFLDLPSQSRWAQEPGFAGTTQAAVDYGHEFLARQRAICPEAKIAIIEGNHDKRLGDYVTKNAMAAFGLRRAGDPPASWPTLSLPYLLRLDELDIEWLEGYPASGLWLNDHIECIHGQKVRSSGSTASAVINDSRHSVIFGHVHRIETQYRTDKTREGGYRKFAATPGCLCRVDGSVPSFKSGTKSTGDPIPNWENWQQGLLLVHYREDDDRYSLEPVEIRSGTAIWRGHVYESR